MYYSIDEIPFSRYGSYFVLSRDAQDGSIFIRDLHGGDEAPSRIFTVSVPDVSAEDLRLTATETVLEIRRASQPEQYASFVIGARGGDTLHIAMHGLTLRLDMTGSRYDSIVPCGEGRYEAIFYKKNRKLMISCLEGEGQRFGEWRLTGDRDGGILLNTDGRDSYVVLDNYRAAWKPVAYETFQQTVDDAHAEFTAWRKALSLPDESPDGLPVDLAAYLLWANFVRAEGVLPYDALYCSKNWMNNIWSWDNCFMGIALSRSHPERAYEQLRTFFPFQDESGCYPDYVNDVYAAYSCCKPPIHAWAFRKMRNANPLLQSGVILEEAYHSFRRVAEYWLRHRIPVGGLLPAYKHGNDSGWDNSSVFHAGVPVVSPDLTAHLIRQLDILSGFASELGLTGDSETLSQQADGLFEALMRELFDGERFFAIHAPTGKRIEEGDSLLLYMPIVIGYRLPWEKLDALVKEMLGKFEATYGLCTENPASGKYKQGGYWLGPIWAPVTYLLIDALRENGYTEDAKRLAGKFFALAAVGKMAENFDAFSGEGFDDPAFAWTSAVYLQLAREYGEQG